MRFLTRFIGTINSYRSVLFFIHRVARCLWEMGCILLYGEEAWPLQPSCGGGGGPAGQRKMECLKAREARHNRMSRKYFHVFRKGNPFHWWNGFVHWAFVLVQKWDIWDVFPQNTPRNIMIRTSQNNWAGGSVIRTSSWGPQRSQLLGHWCFASKMKCDNFL